MLQRRLKRLKGLRIKFVSGAVAIFKAKHVMRIASRANLRTNGENHTTRRAIGGLGYNKSISLKVIRRPAFFAFVAQRAFIGANLQILRLAGPQGRINIKLGAAVRRAKVCFIRLDGPAFTGRVYGRQGAGREVAGIADVKPVPLIQLRGCVGRGLGPAGAECHKGERA